jgi:hypothetical protein
MVERKPVTAASWYAGRWKVFEKPPALNGATVSGKPCEAPTAVTGSDVSGESYMIFADVHSP